MHHLWRRSLCAISAASLLSACSTTSGFGVAKPVPGQVSQTALPPVGFLAMCARLPEACYDSASKNDAGRIAETARGLAAQLGGGRKTSKPAAIKPKSSWSADNWAGFFRGADTVVGLTKARPGEANRPAVTPQLLSVLSQVNDHVNRRTMSRSDQQIFGVPDYWALPFANRAGPMGDCEDFALQKRQLLIEQKIAPSALSIAIVKIGADNIHAVLLVDTDDGLFVLDSLSPRIIEARAARYEWLEHQVSGEAFHWVSGRPWLTNAQG